MAEILSRWQTHKRSEVPDGSAIAKAIDYSLRRWVAFVRYLDDGDLPIDNNHIENRIRPVALGRNNWRFAGSLRAGQRAATVMTLVQSAKHNGHDLDGYLKDVLERLPTQSASRLEKLLPQCVCPHRTASNVLYIGVVWESINNGGALMSCQLGFKVMY